MPKKITTVEEYFAAQGEAVLPHLNEMREIVKASAPEAEEVMGYGMPALKQGKILVYYAAAKKHIGLYPHTGPIEVFAEELKHYKTSKGAIQFPYDKKLPKGLIKKIVKYRLKEVVGKG